MKKFLFALTLIFALTISFTAFAEVQRFKYFKINVPKNWTATQNGATVTIKSNKRNSSLSIAIANRGEATLEDVANRLCKQLNGEDFEADDDGDYTFTYKDMAGADFSVLVSNMGDKKYGLIAFSYENERDSDTIGKILDSAEFIDSEEEEEEE